MCVYMGACEEWMATEIQKGIKISDGVSAIRKYANAKAVRESIQKKRK